VSFNKSISLKDLACKIGAELKGDQDKLVSGINVLGDATEDEISFLTRDSFLDQIESCNAAAIIISKANSSRSERSFLIGVNPHLLYAKATQVFKNLNTTEEPSCISELASINKTAKIGNRVDINPFATISSDVIIAEDVYIGSGVFLGPKVVIGSGTRLYSNSSIYAETVIGKNCIIHSGTVIGSDGLGFAKDSDGWEKIEHLGKVVLGDNVEVGSNTSVDRGSIGDTHIGNNVKIDNLVHLAHNVEIGDGTAIAANSAVAGSTKIGKNCSLAGCSAIVDNIEITDEVHITAGTLITKSIKDSGTYSSGTPFMLNKDWKRNAIAFKKLARKKEPK